jgi:glycosyltransferase involved in cell wall biosynthesis
MATSKNILYIGPYRQNDGWGLAAKGYLLSLLSTEHNISSVPIYLNASSACDILEKNILSSENRVLREYDLIIQKALPPAICPNKYAKNIALTVLENNLIYSDGIQNLKSVDEIWVPSNKEIQCIKNSNIDTPTRSIMQPIPTQDINDIIKRNLRIGFNSKIVDRCYKFYFIGEYIQRKNLHDIIVAFHTEFDLSEPVSLIIKTSIHGMTPQQSLLQIQNDIHTIKQKFRTRKNFKEEIILTDRLSQEQLFSIHQTCDCFISVSYGEAFCRPAAEALCFGKPIIITPNIGIAEMVDEGDKIMVGVQEQPVLMNSPSSIGGLDMYNANETWSIPSILDLKRAMRNAFETKPSVDGSKYITKFSYNNIGKILCQYI